MGWDDPSHITMVRLCIMAILKDVHDKGNRARGEDKIEVRGTCLSLVLWSVDVKPKVWLMFRNGCILRSYEPVDKSLNYPYSIDLCCCKLCFGDVRFRFNHHRERIARIALHYSIRS